MNIHPLQHQQNLSLDLMNKRLGSLAIPPVYYRHSCPSGRGLSVSKYGSLRALNPITSDGFKDLIIISYIILNFNTYFTFFIIYKLQYKMSVKLSDKQLFKKSISRQSVEDSSWVVIDPVFNHLNSPQGEFGDLV